MISKNLVPLVTYNGDNATSVFGITFPTFEFESLKIYLTLIIDGTVVPIVKDVDYSLKDLNVNGVDGSLTLIDSGQAWINAGGLDVQYRLHVEFDSEAFQPASFRSWTNSSPLTLEQTLDRLTMSLKAMNYQLSLLDNTQTDQNTQDIADIKANILIIEADVLAISQDLANLEAEYYSHAFKILDNTVAADFGAEVDNDTHKHMIFEAITVRNGLVQYDRQIVVNRTASTFTLSPIEKTGDQGVTFTIVNQAGNVGAIKYTTTNTGFDGEIYFRLYKFDKEVL